MNNCRSLFFIVSYVFCCQTVILGSQLLSVQDRINQLQGAILANKVPAEKISKYLGLDQKSAKSSLKTVADRMNYYRDLIAKKEIVGQKVEQFEVLLAKDDSYFDTYLEKHLAEHLDDVDYQDPADGQDTMTMLFESTMYNYHHAINRLLEKGADPFLITLSGESALTKSLSSSDQKIHTIFKPYLDKCDIMTLHEEDHESILAKIIRYQNHKALERLSLKINSKEINKRNLPEGQDLVEYSIVFDNPFALNHLIGLSGRYDNDKMSLPELAAVSKAASVINGITDTVKPSDPASAKFENLKHYYDLLHTPNRITGKTSLMYALQGQDVATIIAFIRSLKDPSVVDNQGNGLLHYIAAKKLDAPYNFPYSCNVDIAKIVMRHVDINTVNNRGENPLFNAVRSGLVDLVFLLKNQGINTGQFNKNKKTPLMIALEQIEELEAKEKLELEELDEQLRTAVGSSNEIKKIQNDQDRVSRFYDKKIASMNDIAGMLRD